MLGFLFYFVSSVLIFRFSSIVGSGIEMLGRGWVLGFFFRFLFLCFDDFVFVLDFLFRDNFKLENIFIRIYIIFYYKIYLEIINYFYNLWLVNVFFCLN